MLSYRFYTYINGYHKQYEGELEPILEMMNEIIEFAPEMRVIIIEHEEDTNTDSIFFCDKAGNFKKGKVRKL